MYSSFRGSNVRILSRSSGDMTSSDLSIILANSNKSDEVIGAAIDVENGWRKPFLNSEYAFANATPTFISTKALLAYLRKVLGSFKFISYRISSLKIY